MFQKQPEQTRSRGQLFRDEMGQTVDHAMRAAGHAAGGLRSARTQMAPAAVRVRSAASQRWAEFNRAAAMAGRAPRGRPRAARTRRSPSRLGLLIAGGAALGVAAATVMRRRRQQEWERYEEERLMEPVGQQPPGADVGGAPPEPMMMSDPETGAMGAETDVEEDMTGRSAGPQPAA